MTSICFIILNIFDQHRFFFIILILDTYDGYRKCTHRLDNNIIQRDNFDFRIGIFTRKPVHPSQFGIPPFNLDLNALPAYVIKRSSRMADSIELYFPMELDH